MTEHRKSSDELISYYERFQESKRLFEGVGKLEFERTKDLLKRFLPQPPAVILDVGGGSGVYSCLLARQGYEVHLVDPVPVHVEQAINASQEQPDFPVKSCTVGDARKLSFPDSFADAVLFSGRCTI